MYVKYRIMINDSVLLVLQNWSGPPND